MARSHKAENAGALFMEWRRKGVPTLITAHEAWKLTDGKVGTPDDHSTPLGLAYVAREATK